MAVEYPLTIDRETGLSWIFLYRTKGSQQSCIPAGSTATMIFEDLAGLVPPVELTTASGHIALDASTGRVAVTILRSEAVALGFHQANYKFYLNRPDGSRKKLWFGAVRKV